MNSPATGAPTVVGARLAASSADWGKLPLYFVPNQGQADPLIDFSVAVRGATTYFKPDGVTIAVTGQGDDVAGYWRDAAPGDTDDSPRRRWAVEVDFVGASASVHPVGIEQTDAIFSYFERTAPRTSGRLPSPHMVA